MRHMCLSGANTFFFHIPEKHYDLKLQILASWLRTDVILEICIFSNGRFFWLFHLPFFTSHFRVWFNENQSRSMNQSSFIVWCTAISRIIVSRNRMYQLQRINSNRFRLSYIRTRSFCRTASSFIMLALFHALLHCRRFTYFSIRQKNRAMHIKYLPQMNLHENPSNRILQHTKNNAPPVVLMFVHKYSIQAHCVQPLKHLKWRILSTICIFNGDFAEHRVWGMMEIVYSKKD